MSHLRLVLDTNVLLSALLFNQSTFSWLRQSWQTEVIRPLVCRETTEELLRVLSYPKFKLTKEDQEELLGDYLPWCETVTVSPNAEVPDCRDPFDRPFLLLARSAKADGLITGDKDLLVLADVFDIPILPPSIFKERFLDTQS